MSAPDRTAPLPGRARLFIPLGVFVLIATIGFVGFQLGSRDVLPSALLDRPFPTFTARLLDDPTTTVGRDVLLGAPVLVNVWATWCPTCKAEHDALMRIQRETGLRMIGVNYKDDRDLALKWLADYGNPFELVLMDDDGQLAIELGVYGAPETFLVDRDGTIVYKRVGDVNARVWQREMVPVLERLDGFDASRAAGALARGSQ